MSYPTAQHLEVALKSNSIWPDDATKQQLARFQADIAARGAADQWEKTTGWTPFVAGGVSTRTLDWPDYDGYLDLRGGALEIASVSLSGKTLVAGRDFVALPRSAPQRGEAYTGIQLRTERLARGGWSFGETDTVQGVQVAAHWGRVLECPGDVFLVLQKRAIATMMDLLENEQSVASISQDGFSKSLDIVGTRTQKDIAETGDKDFAKIAESWKRVPL